METAIKTQEKKDGRADTEVIETLLTRVWRVCKRDTDVFATALKRMAKSEFRRRVKGKDVDLSLLPPDYCVMAVSEINVWTAEPETRSVVKIEGGKLITMGGDTVNLDLVDSVDLLDIADRAEYLYRMQQRLKEEGHED